MRRWTDAAMQDVNACLRGLFGKPRRTVRGRFPPRLRRTGPAAGYRILNIIDLLAPHAPT